MQNKRMLEMKYNMMIYNYRVRHIKGSINSIADSLSRRPSWLVKEGNHEVDYDTEHDLDIEERALSAIISAVLIRM